MGKPMIYSKHSKIERLSMEVYRGYEFAVMNLGTHPCCYIKLPKGHKYENVHYNNIPLDVHGELTYSESYLAVAVVDGKRIKEETGYWIGWDYAHWGDYLGYDPEPNGEHIYTTEELEMDCRDAIDQLCELCGE